MLSVTIGIPYFNRRSYINRAIESIDVANRDNRINIIIFDDGSDEQLNRDDFLRYQTSLEVIRRNK